MHLHSESELHNRAWFYSRWVFADHPTPKVHFDIHNHTSTTSSDSDRRPNPTTAMFGALRPTSILNGGLLWKSPYRLSSTRKANLRQRLKRVDSVIAAVAESGIECRALARALELPKESEMPAKGGYGFWLSAGAGWG